MSNIFVPSAGAFFKLSRATIESISDPSATVEEIEKDYGLFTSDSAVEISDESSTEDIQSLGGHTQRTVVTESSVSFTVSLLEDTPAVRELRYGASEQDGKIVFNPLNRERGAFLIYSFDKGQVEGETVHKMWLFKDAQVSEADAQGLNTGEALTTNVTLKAYGDDPVIILTKAVKDTVEPETPEGV